MKKVRNLRGPPKPDPGELPAWPLRFERRKFQVRHLGPEPDNAALGFREATALSQRADRIVAGMRHRNPDVAQGDAGGLKARFLGVRVPTSGPEARVAQWQRQRSEGPSSVSSTLTARTTPT